MSHATEAVVILESQDDIVTRTAAGPVSRRQVLRVGAGGMAAVAGAGILPGFDQRAESAVGIFLAKVATAAAVGWLVETLLDEWYASRFKKEAKITTRYVSPTHGRNKFHDSHASTQTIEGFSVSRRLVQTDRVDLSVGRNIHAACYWGRRESCLSPYDLNTTEAITIHQNWKCSRWYDIPLPASVRSKATCYSQSMLRTELKSYNVDPAKWKVDYTRKFRAPSWKKDQTGMAISQVDDPKKKSLVIVQA